MRAICLSMLLCLVTGPALASNGRVEISPHDVSASSPTYTISQPGSYVLTGILPQHNASQPVIRITTANVTLDLNGFGIAGTWQNGDTTSTTGHGIHGASTAGRIFGGFVNDVAGHGIYAPGAVVRDVIVRQVGRYGIQAKEVHHARVSKAREIGIYASKVVEATVTEMYGTYGAIGGPIGIRGNDVRHCHVGITTGYGVAGSGMVRVQWCNIFVGTTISAPGNAIVAGLSNSNSKLYIRGNVVQVSGPNAPPNSQWWTASDFVANAGENYKVGYQF